MGHISLLIRAYRAELIVFGASLLVRALYAIFILTLSGEHGFLAFSDAQAFYYQAALNLLNHHTFSLAPSAPFVPDAYHTILYPLFVAGLLALHLPLFGVILVQDTLAAVAVVLIYRSAMLLTNSRRVAIVAATLAAIEPMSIYWSGLLMSDTLFAFLMVAAVYLLLTKRPYWSAGLLGLATLTRPIGLYMVPVFLGLIVYQEIGKRRSLIEIGRVVAVTLAIFVIVVAPWYVRNKLTFNTWALSSAGWYLAYNFPVYEFAREEHLPWTAVPIGDDEWVRFDFAHSVLYKQAALSVISRDPAGFAIVYVKRSIYSLVSDRYDYLVHQVIEAKMPGLYARMAAAWKYSLLAGRAFWFAVYVLCLFAFAERRLRPWWIFFGVLVGMNVFLSGGINPVGTDMSRYMLPFYLFFFVFGGVGAQVVIDRLRRRTAQVWRGG